jgi:hypothetical protein
VGQRKKERKKEGKKERKKERKISRVVCVKSQLTRSSVVSTANTTRIMQYSVT